MAGMHYVITRLPDRRRQQTVRVYLMYCYMQTIIAKTTHSFIAKSHELSYDDQLFEFQQCLDLGRTYAEIDSLALLRGESSGHTLNAIQSGIIPPICFTALKCRDPSIRLEAVKLLKWARDNKPAW
jgi:hypothetical protein